MADRLLITLSDYLVYCPDSDERSTVTPSCFAPMHQEETGAAVKGSATGTRRRPDNKALAGYNLAMDSHPQRRRKKGIAGIYNSKGGRRRVCVPNGERITIRLSPAKTYFVLRQGKGKGVSAGIEALISDAMTETIHFYIDVSHPTLGHCILTTDYAKRYGQPLLITAEGNVYEACDVPEGALTEPFAGAWSGHEGTLACLSKFPSDKNWVFKW